MKWTKIYSSIKKWLPIFLPIILGFLTTYLGYRLNKEIKEREALATINNQNTAAYNSAMSVLKNENVQANQRIAFVENVNERLKTVNKELYKLVDEQKLRILTLNTMVISLNSIKDSLIAIQQAVEIPDFLVGKLLSFSNRTDFYEYSNQIILGNPSKSLFNISFVDFNMMVGLARNKEGVWSGLVSFQPNVINNYVKIKSVDVRVDKDEYIRVEEKRVTFGIGMGGGLLLYPETYIHIGVSGLLNNTHQLSIGKTIGKEVWIIDYRYYPFVF